MYRELEVARLRRQDREDEATSLAWMVNWLERHKKLPALKALLQRFGSERQTVQEKRTAHREALEVMSQQYGIPLQQRKKTKGKTFKPKAEPTVLHTRVVKKKRKVRHR